MEMRRTWVGVGEEFFDTGDWVPSPVTEEEAAAARLLAAEQLGVLNATDPSEVPGTAAEAQAWAEIVATLRTQGLDDGTGWAPEVLQGALTAATDALGVAAALEEGDLTRVFDDGLRSALEAAGQARTQVESVTFALAVQAHARGLHTAVGLSLVDWVRVRCPWLSVQDAAALKVVVEASARHWGAPLGEAVREGRTSVARAAKVARVMTRLGRALDPDQAEAYAAIATEAACEREIGEKDLAVVCRRLLSDLLEEPPEDGDAEDRSGADPAPQALRECTRTPLGEGMTRYVIDAPEADAVMFDGVLDGALAGPVPGPEGERDPRDAGQRRYDAVKTVLSRGLAHPGAPASSARASVILTVAADPVTGRPAGVARTGTGTVLSAAAAGRFACVGDLTPVVLGPMGQPLDLGITRRLASPGQFKALMVRDRHCTYPGCTVPGGWCEAHHLIWWCRGGNTDLVLLVLLCPRHHTLVHDKDLTATVTGNVVTWHL